MPNEPLETTVALLDRAKKGDSDAVEKLLERCVPPLTPMGNRAATAVGTRAG